MKNITITLVLLVSLSLTVNAQETIQLNKEKSVIHWMGSTFIGFGNHFGTVNFEKGHLLISDDLIAGGEFQINMNTIANVDGGYNDGLVDHLKDPDFFDVPNHPNAKLVITEVVYKDENHAEMKADLTIKNITKPISYVAELNYEDKELTTNFSIDRTQWNIIYATKTVTDIKERMISDTIEFKVELRFK